MKRRRRLAGKTALGETVQRQRKRLEASKKKKRPKVSKDKKKKKQKKPEATLSCQTSYSNNLHAFRSPLKSTCLLSCNRSTAKEMKNRSSFGLHV